MTVLGGGATCWRPLRTAAEAPLPSTPPEVRLAPTNPCSGEPQPLQIAVVAPDGELVQALRAGRGGRPGVSEDIRRVPSVDAALRAEDGLLEDAHVLLVDLDAAEREPGGVSAAIARLQHRTLDVALMLRTKSPLPGAARRQAMRAGVQDVLEGALTEDLVDRVLASADRHAFRARMRRRDPLTGLADRRTLVERFTHAAQRVGPGGELALLVTDLDRFRHINDALGHRAGDAIIQQAANRLAQVVPVRDVLARTGGDEFGILLLGASASGAKDAARQVLAALSEPFHVDGAPVSLTASVGMARFPADGRSFHDVLRRAELAMYRAKRDRTGLGLHARHLEAKVARMAWLQRELRVALGGGALELHFQPVVARSLTELYKAEALLRWHHPDEGWVSPGEFIPLAEEVGLIDQIDRYVLARAIALAAQHGFPVSVNITSGTLRSAGLVEHVADLLEAHGLPGEELHLELTERIFAEPEATLSTIHALRALGARIAIDDFGTGYSSLSYLRRFPLDALKVDRSFVRELGVDPRTSAVTETVVRLAQDLGLVSVAEGVETPEQLARLEAMGVDMLQGFLLGRPMPIEAFLSWRERLPRGELSAVA